MPNLPNHPMITRLDALRVEHVDLVRGDTTEIRIEVFAGGELPLISLTPDDAMVFAMRIRRLAGLAGASS